MQSQDFNDMFVLKIISNLECPVVLLHSLVTRVLPQSVSSEQDKLRVSLLVNTR